MRRYFTDIPVDIFEPERRKFRPILLMIHDLWVGGWCWQDWGTRLCNLGWECWAVSLRGRDPAKSLAEGKGQTFADCVGDLNRIAASCASPMIVIAHGFGAALARAAYDKPHLVAEILLAPVSKISATRNDFRQLRLLRLRYLPSLILRQQIRIRSSDFTTLWLNCVGQELRQEILEGLVPESPSLVRESLQRTTDLPVPKTGLPLLCLGGTEDRLMPGDAVKALAMHLGGACRLYPERGHWMLHEKGWDEVVNEIHRWILTTMGESILITEEE